MEKNVPGQKWRVYLFDSTTLLPVTGDSANITAQIIRDDGELEDLQGGANPVEIINGYYEFDVSAVESTGKEIIIFPKSSTSAIFVCKGVPEMHVTQAPNISDLTVTEDGKIIAKNLDTIDTFIKRVFSDQRNQSQLIEDVTRKLNEIQSQEGKGRLNIRGGRDGNTG